MGTEQRSEEADTFHGTGGRAHLVAKSLAEPVEEYALNGFPNREPLATAERCSMRDRLPRRGCEPEELIEPRWWPVRFQGLGITPSPVSNVSISSPADS